MADGGSAWDRVRLMFTQQRMEREQEEKIREGGCDEKFKMIKAMFHEADVDGGGGLDMDEFRVSMKKIMGDVEDEDIDIIFMKVDTNCDGTVDLGEYMNYMHKKGDQKIAMFDTDRHICFPTPVEVIPVPKVRPRPVVGIQLIPSQHHQQESGGPWSGSGSEGPGPPRAGTYLTLNEAGILNFWTQDLKHKHTVDLCKLRLAHRLSFSRTLHVTHTVCLSNLNQLAVASTCRHVEFYKIITGIGQMDYLYSLTVDRLVVAMDYWSKGTKAVFSVGGDEGSVSVFISFNVNHCGLFDRSGRIVDGHRIDASSLMKSNNPDFLCFKVSVHGDWCRQLRFLPELNAVASCCWSDTNSLVITAIPHSPRAKDRAIRRTAFQIKRGVACFDFSADLDQLGGVMTGGTDGVLKMWKPALTTSPMFKLEGHTSAITHVLLNARHMKILSISTDKNVRVWDLAGRVCLQSIPPRDLPLGHAPFSSIYHNADDRTLILATSSIGVLRVYLKEQKPSTSHKMPLCAALYNPCLKQVVSGCHGGMVRVWDIVNGKKVMQFQTSPEKPAWVTAMAFDGPMRRLITGSEDGAVRLWNFNSGTLLSLLPTQAKDKVTGITFIDQRFFVSGWSKRVMWYQEKKNGEEECYKVCDQYHAKDICTQHAYGDEVLATADSNGDIIIWNVKNGRSGASCRFNASDGPRPLLANRVSSAHRPPPVGMEKQAVKKVLFLNTRKSGPNTAVLLTSTDAGYIHAWSIHKQGGLLGRFEAVNTEGAFISSMSTDAQDQTLLTGDSTGDIAQWDITRYCLDVGTEGHAQRSAQSSADTHTTQDDWTVAVDPPPLLSSWRAHVSQVTSVQYLERYRLILTGALDCNARLWAVDSSYVGTFGVEEWDLLGPPQGTTRELPKDLLE